MRGERLIKEIKSIVPFQFTFKDPEKFQNPREVIYIGAHGEIWIYLTISPSYVYDFTISDWYGHGDWIKVKASEKYKIFQTIYNFYEWFKIHKPISFKL